MSGKVQISIPFVSVPFLRDQVSFLYHKSYKSRQINLNRLLLTWCSVLQPRGVSGFKKCSCLLRPCLLFCTDGWHQGLLLDCYLFCVIKVTFKPCVINHDYRLCFLRIRVIFESRQVKGNRETIYLCLPSRSCCWSCEGLQLPKRSPWDSYAFETWSSLEVCRIYLTEIRRINTTGLF